MATAGADNSVAGEGAASDKSVDPAATLVGMGYVDCQSLSYVLPDGRTLFADASFRVGDGTKTALVGANGTGKTTLLRLIAGDIAPSDGRRRA